jgi:hypothetical protein
VSGRRWWPASGRTAALGVVERLLGCEIELPYCGEYGQGFEERRRRTVQRERAVGDARGRVARGDIIERGRLGLGGASL